MKRFRKITVIISFIFLVPFSQYCERITIPDLSTIDTSNITPVTASSGGIINNDGGAEVISRGVCWKTSEVPTVNDFKTFGSTGTGSFSSSLKYLVPNTKYYLRAYATNKVGTSYGNQVSFTTKIGTGDNIFIPGPTSDTISDIGGNVYITVKIGSQWWTAENLRTTKYNNGDLIGTTIPSTLNISKETNPKYQWGEQTNAEIYGRLYTWYAVTDDRKICPIGWRVASDTDWSILRDYLIKNGFGFQGSGDDIAKSMAATSKWLSDGTAGTIGNDQKSNNRGGFSAFPAGLRLESGQFSSIGFGSYWWTSTEAYSGYGSGCDLYYDRAFLYGPPGMSKKVCGMSVRCIKE